MCMEQSGHDLGPSFSVLHEEGWQTCLIFALAVPVCVTALELSGVWDDDYVFADALLRSWKGHCSDWFEPSRSAQY